MSERLRTDVVIVGSGAGGAAVAGELAARGVKTIVLEAGPQWFDVPGTHIRNVYPSETNLGQVGTLIHDKYMSFPSGEAQAPAQAPGLKVAHGVGGMFALWMGNCPHPDDGELPDWRPRAEWEPYLSRAAALMHIDPEGGSNSANFHRLVERVKSAVGPLPAYRQVRPMPVAARYVNGMRRFTASDDFFCRGGMWPETLTILPNRIVHEVIVEGSRAVGVRGYSRTEPGNGFEVLAAMVVVAGGTVGSAQLLAASRIDCGPALGRYVFEHPALHSRVILKAEIRAGNRMTSRSTRFGFPIQQAMSGRTRSAV